MEVVVASPAPTGGTPFRDHDVREWSRIDSITGALERARLETDSWSASTSEACHKYGKVVDSRARTGVDGSLQAQASRQFEVFQSKAAGARVQVVKTKTVSSSRWSGIGETAIQGLGFEDLQLPLNTLDLSSQKSKASVGRSVSRRPPTRHPRSQPPLFSNDLNTHIKNAHFTAAANLHRVSRLCHQIHESAVRNAFGRKSPTSKRNSIDSSTSGIEITEIEGSGASNSDVHSHSNLARTRSTSSDDIYQIPENDSITRSIEDLEDLRQPQSWIRTSKIRRSLQYPKTSSPTISSKPVDLPENAVNVKKIRDELEKGKRLTTALNKYSVAVDLDSLDHIIQSISSSSSIDKSSIDENLNEYDSEQLTSKPQKKRDSFVTVESLQEVRGRLRRTSSPGSDPNTNESKLTNEDSDDGIVTDPKTETALTQKRVKSYVFGMEKMMQNKKPVIGTGSLESRSKVVNGTGCHKSEDWYNRRKSYGFEKVHGQEEPSSISLKNKNLAESSTDSGICRSSEIMVVPTATRTNNNNYANGRRNSDSESDVENKYNSHNKSHNGINYGNVKKMTSIFSQDDKNSHYNRPSDELTNTWNKRSTFKENDWQKNDIKSTTITIPIVKNNNVVDLSWNGEPDKEIKRHSIAVDEAKYATNGTENRFRKTSLVMNEPYLKNDAAADDDNLNNNRKPKKVLFCKTEVHFAAESGKVNIVETDEKPPPTQNFRRRRRNSGSITDVNESFNKNGLPVLHFGDSSYEKTMFGITNDEEPEPKTVLNGSASIYENLQPSEQRVPSAFSVVTVNTNNTNSNRMDYTEEERREYADNDNIKGILKNKPIKPKPYHLGETTAFTDSNSDEDSRRWGVRLRHVPKEDPPIWKSTVTVHNSYYDNQDETEQNNEQPINDKPEFQKLLRNLRPTKKPDYLSDNENRYSDSFANIRVVPTTKDNRRSSWSVADKVKLVDDVQESKVYSTKVNFGEGEAIVVQNDQSTWPRSENLSKDSSENLRTHDVSLDARKVNSTYNRYSIHSSNSKFSPVVLKKTIPITTEHRAPSEPLHSKPKQLHSPSLLGRKTESSIKVEHNRHSPTRDHKSLPDSTLQTKFSNDRIVLRQPKKSEMTYFGVHVSPKSSTKNVQTAVIKKDKKLLEKPDLLQHHKRSPTPTKTKPRQPSPEINRDTSSSPVYENLKPLTKTVKSMYSCSQDFDSSILDELTKAADQILQAVNGYTDEDCQNRLSSDEEEPRKPLDTISETKSWKNSAQDIDIKNQLRMRPTLASAAKVRVKRTSSTSSVESLSKDKRKSVSTERRPTTATVTKSTVESIKKISDSSSVKASTKARRLQRASSREALLQSHGSSSEDLPAKTEAPLRKPRLVKKTKTAQLTITNGMELKKPGRRSREEKVESSKSDERILGSLSEIRHKTSLSTITSTVDKSSRDRSRDRSRTRNEESKLKSISKRENSSKGTISSTSTRPTSSTSRGHQHHHQQRPATASKDSGVTQHRISTANIKKCHRSEVTTRH